MEKIHSNIIINIMIIIILTSISILLISPNMIYLSYNLFLALLPLLFSTFALKKDINFALKSLLIILWLLFFPNAIYIFTDIIHLSNLEFYTREPYNIIYNMDIIIWYRLVVTLLSTFLGIAISFMSYQNIVKVLNITKESISYYILLVSVSLLSGLAIYIGRFIRLNSWDVIINASNTLNAIKDSILSDKVLFIALFGALQFLTILINDIIYKRR